MIKRELAEEVGAKVKYVLKEVPVAVGRHSYYSKVNKYDQHLFWVFFEAKYLSGGIDISDEHKECLWVGLTRRNYKRYFVRGPLEGAYNYLFHRLS